MVFWCFVIFVNMFVVNRIWDNRCESLRKAREEDKKNGIPPWTAEDDKKADELLKKMGII